MRVRVRGFPVQEWRGVAVQLSKKLKEIIEKKKLSKEK
jgi:hypothetical protein